MRPIRTFLDTSALFPALWSQEGGGRMVLQLGEAGAVQVVVSRQVLGELEGALRRKAPAARTSLALLLDRIRVEVAPEPAPEILATCEALVTHRGDARILATAAGCGVEFFVTLDRQHFLDNTRLGATVPFVVGTPGSLLAWFRRRLLR